MDVIAPMIVMVTLILTVGGVLILRPLSKRLGSYLEAATRQRLNPSPDPEMGRIRDLLGSIDTRLNQIEERQDFAEALISASDPRLPPVPPPARAQERN